ncbi:MAG TPA: phosphotransferase family protein [Acidimicrobiia bacterium]|nr:phosphotransferase family protein [Acidimicrobiia bacterium]
MDEALREWIEGITGGRIVDARRPPGGGSRELYLVDVERPDGTVVPLVLRCEAGGSFTGTEISPAKEAVVYRALEPTAVPVPRVIGMAPGDAALLMERVPGTSDLASAGDAARSAAMTSFVDALAALHNLDVDALPLPGFARPATAEDHARLDLAMWARLADEGVLRLDPLVRFAGAWLHAHAPATVRRTVLVQGDTGPGNFVFEDGAVTGIVDWEFAHVGDPMDDWAWVQMRAPDLELGALGRRYSERTGIPLDADRIRYYRAAVDYRCAVTTSLAVSRGGGARGWAPYLLVTERYVVGLADRMSELLGIAETVPVPALEPTPRTRWFDTLLDGVRVAVRNLDDPDLREPTRNLQILVHYLRAYDQVGAAVDDLDRRDREQTMGRDALDDERFADLVTQAGAAGDEAVFRYLLRHTARQRVLWASLLDRT